MATTATKESAGKDAKSRSGVSVRSLSITDIKPYEGNPRINDGAVDAVAASIAEFGFRQPIVVDANNVIICGHTRWKAAKKLGLKAVPVHIARDLTPEQIRAYRVADNKLHDLSSWDSELLAIELAELQALEVDLNLLGFTGDELQKLFGDEVTEGQCAPDPPSAPVVDAYAAVLATDRSFTDAPVRLALLDIVDVATGEVVYSRYDLNGDGVPVVAAQSVSTAGTYRVDEACICSPTDSRSHSRTVVNLAATMGFIALVATVTR